MVGHLNHWLVALLHCNCTDGSQTLGLGRGQRVYRRQVIGGLVEAVESALFLSQLHDAGFGGAPLRGECVGAVIAGLRG